MQALLEACQEPDYPAEIVLVISNRPKAAGIEIAQAAGIPTKVINHKKYPDRASFEADLTAAFEEAKVDLICNAGFMRLLTNDFVEHWRDRQLNIHPSLLPAFKGLNTHQRALDEGVKIAGCTVHFVRTEMDAGPIIAQAAVPILTHDDADSLAARVLRAEHQLYPHALALAANELIYVENERVLHKNQGDDARQNHSLFVPKLGN